MGRRACRARGHIGQAAARRITSYNSLGRDWHIFLFPIPDEVDFEADEGALSVCKHLYEGVGVW